MVDLGKIDTYFNKTDAYAPKEHQRGRKHSRALIFAKLLMPSIAALLIGLIVVMPHWHKDTIINEYDLTIPKKGEIEKLHAEKAVFTTTDKNGKISTFTADSMDETAAGSKVIKIIFPKGKIPVKADEVFIDVASDIGYFDQANNNVRLEENVRAVYDKTTTVETNEAAYDFNTAYAQGNQNVFAFGDWGKLWAEGFAYDKNANILYLQKKSKLVHEDNVLTASKQTRYYQDENKIEAEGHVVLKTPQSKVYADKVVLWFENAQNMALNKVEASGNVTVETENATAKSERGLYLPQKDEIEMYGNVSIEKDGNVVYGDRATTNLKTMVSRLTMDGHHKSRVSGVIKGSSLRRKNNEDK